MNKSAPFVERQFYHVYNRTNNKESLFLNDENRRYFLKRYRDYLKPFVHTFAYALLGNHFHFAIRVKSKMRILRGLKKISSKNQTVAMKRLLAHSKGTLKPDQPSNSTKFDGNLDKLILHQFQCFFNSYSKAFNKWHGRKGNLFHRTFKRYVIDPEKKFQYLIYYIHHNARKHKLVDNFENYPYQSFHDIVNYDNSLVECNYVLKQFGGLILFRTFHENDLLENKFEAMEMDVK